MRKTLILFACLTILAMASPHSPAMADPHDHAEKADSHEHEGEEEHGHEEGVIHMDAAQIAKAGIATAPVAAMPITASTPLPGQIVLADDRRALVTPRVSGTVQKVLKNIGDTVAAGEALAIIESPEIAEASAEYLAAKRAENLAKTIYVREEKLWKEKVTAEQDYLTARNAHQEAKIRLNLATQKLRAAGQEPDKAESGSTYTLLSPIAGRIIRRDLTLGAYVDTAHTAFEVADTSLLWVEAAMPASDISSVLENQEVSISASEMAATGTVIFVSPAVDTTTRTTKVVVSLPNPEGKWRAGTFATVALPTGATVNGLSIPFSALQTVEGKPSVFIQTPEGFALREVKTGTRSGTHIVIEDGLSAGETVATDNAFILKAELGKSEAEHVH